MRVYAQTLKSHILVESQLKSDLDKAHEDESRDQKQMEKRLTTSLTFGDFCPSPAAEEPPEPPLLVVRPRLIRT